MKIASPHSNIEPGIRSEIHHTLIFAGTSNARTKICQMSSIAQWNTAQRASPKPITFQLAAITVLCRRFAEKLSNWSTSALSKWYCIVLVCFFFFFFF